MRVDDPVVLFELIRIIALSDDLVVQELVSRAVVVKSLIHHLLKGFSSDPTVVSASEQLEVLLLELLLTLVIQYLPLKGLVLVITTLHVVLLRG